MKGGGDASDSFLMELLERENVLQCAWGANTRSRTHLPKVLIFFTHPSLNVFLWERPNQVWTHSKRCGAVGFFKVEIFSLNQPTENVVQNAKLLAEREGKELVQQKKRVNEEAWVSKFDSHTFVVLFVRVFVGGRRNP